MEFYVWLITKRVLPSQPRICVAFGFVCCKNMKHILALLHRYWLDSRECLQLTAVEAYLTNIFHSFQETNDDDSFAREGGELRQ